MDEQITVTIRESDMGTLRGIAEREWREPGPQASALLEQVLRSARAKAGTADKPQGAHRGRRPNGVAALA